jgi:pyruvate/2-oxoglutarate dehydrogenase complex dihydrolipoamide dehydrogenase (E3) component
LPPARRPYLLETSLPGVFAAGDVRGGNVKRVASAVGEGSIVISFVIKYSESKADIDSLPTEQVRWIQQVITAVNDLVK